MMKRAPIIPKAALATSHPSPNDVPAAPMVDSLIARVGAMAKGNIISIPVCGKDVKFTLETIAAASIEKSTQVWAGNERDQELLTEDALDDLIPSFLIGGQQTPAFGRKNENGIEVADGSRRRKAAILTNTDYRILVGELDDEQMDTLSKLGNDYRPTSAFERGKRYQNRLITQFDGNISALAESENISRKIISRCIATAKLPKEVVALFPHPGELSARSGELLFKSFEGKEELLLNITTRLSEKKKAGLLLESEDILQSFLDALKDRKESINHSVVRRKFAPGASAQYKGNKVTFNLDRAKLPSHFIEQIENLLISLNSKHSH